MLNYRKAYISLSIIFILFLTAFVLLFLADYLIEKRMKAAILKLQGSFSSLDVSLFSRSLQIDELSWSSGEVTTDSAAHTLYIGSIKLRGIHLLPLFFGKQVVVNHLEVDSAQLTLIRDLAFKIKTSSQTSFKKLIIRQISLKGIAVSVKENTAAFLSGFLKADIKYLRFERDSVQKLAYSFS